MFEMFAKADLEIPCPNCQAKVKIKLGDAYANKSVECPGCGSTIRLQGNEKDKQEIDRIESDFKRGIEDVNKKLSM